MKYHNENGMYVKSVELDVKDLTLMKDFYLKVFGFIILSEDDAKVVLSANGQDPLLTLNKLENAIVNPNLFGLYHIAYLLPKRKDLASFVLHINNLKIPFGAGDHLVSEAIYFDDPEGNGIEVYVDRDASVWIWENGLVKMSTLQVDFDDLLKEKLYEYSQIPKETVIGHVHLSVDDIEKNEAFYIERLGFNLVSKLQDSAYFVSDKDYHHHIAFNVWNKNHKVKPNKNNTGLKKIVLNVGDQHALKNSTLFDPNGITVDFKKDNE